MWTFQFASKNELGKILLSLLYSSKKSMSFYSVCTFAPPSGCLINSQCPQKSEKSSKRIWDQKRKGRSSPRGWHLHRRLPSSSAILPSALSLGGKPTSAPAASGRPPDAFSDKKMTKSAVRPSILRKRSHGTRAVRWDWWEEDGRDKVMKGKRVQIQEFLLNANCMNLDNSFNPWFRIFKTSLLFGC